MEGRGGTVAEAERDLYRVIAWNPVDYYMPLTLTTTKPSTE
jgi:hypothetical protein